MKHIIWLIVGIGLLALIVGFMVGASATPVVAVVIPAIFGLVATALGFIGATGVEKKIDDLVNELKRSIEKDNLSEVSEPLNRIKTEVRVVSEQVGKVLVVFTLLYSSGLMIGIKARLDDWFVPSKIKNTQLPWAGVEPPPTTSDAVKWIGLQERLLDLGYNESQIKEIYNIQLSEWKTKNGPNQQPTPPVATPSPTPVTQVPAGTKQRRPPSPTPSPVLVTQTPTEETPSTETLTPSKVREAKRNILLTPP